jgi:hypothetical protein
VSHGCWHCCELWRKSVDREGSEARRDRTAEGVVALRHWKRRERSLGADHCRPSARVLHALRHKRSTQRPRAAVRAVRPTTILWDSNSPRRTRQNSPVMSFRTRRRICSADGAFASSLLGPPPPPNAMVTPARGTRSFGAVDAVTAGRAALFARPTAKSGGGGRKLALLGNSPGGSIPEPTHREVAFRHSLGRPRACGPIHEMRGLDMQRRRRRAETSRAVHTRRATRKHCCARDWAVVPLWKRPGYTPHHHTRDTRPEHWPEQVEVASPVTFPKVPAGQGCATPWRQ